MSEKEPGIAAQRRRLQSWILVCEAGGRARWRQGTVIQGSRHGGGPPRLSAKEMVVSKNKKSQRPKWTARARRRLERGAEVPCGWGDCTQLSPPGSVQGEQTRPPLNPLLPGFCRPLWASLALIVLLPVMCGPLVPTVTPGAPGLAAPPLCLAGGLTSCNQPLNGEVLKARGRALCFAGASARPIPRQPCFSSELRPAPLLLSLHLHHQAWPEPWGLLAKSCQCYP